MRKLRSNRRLFNRILKRTQTQLHRYILNTQQNTQPIIRQNTQQNTQQNIQPIIRLNPSIPPNPLTLLNQHTKPNSLKPAIPQRPTTTKQPKLRSHR